MTQQPTRPSMPPAHLATQLLHHPAIATRLARHADVASLVKFSSSCSAARTSLSPSNLALWTLLLNDHFPVNPLRIQSLLTPVVGPLDLNTTAVANPHKVFTHYHALYSALAKTAAASAGPSNTDSDSESDSDDAAALSAQLAALSHSASGHLPELDGPTHELAKAAFDAMAGFESTGNPDAMIQGVTQALQVLAVYPFHPGIAHLLAFACSILDLLPLALEVAEFGLALDPEFDDLVDLHAKISSALATQSKSTPLLSTAHPPTLRPHIAQTLQRVFNKYDMDKDGLWTAHDLREFIKLLNGTAPPLAFCYQFIDMFGGQVGATTKKLPIEGLLEFFAQQSANEPDETVKDLEKLGVKI